MPESALCAALYLSAISEQSLCDLAVCSLPYEYCEFTPLIKKCRANFEAVGAERFPEVDSPEALADLMSHLGLTGGDAASKRAQSAKKPASTEDSGAASSKKKDAQPAQIVIELNNRNKKKHITTVKGLEARAATPRHADETSPGVVLRRAQSPPRRRQAFGVDAAAAAKLFGKRFACGSALKKGQAGQPDQIEIQGSCLYQLPAFIVEKLKMQLDDIVLVLDGKKVKAADAPSG